MTTSIVFDDARMPCNEISFWDVDNEPRPPSNRIHYDSCNKTVISSNWLTDPTEPRLALQRLRFLKERETGNNIVTPNTVGRDRGNNIVFGGNNYKYHDYVMRRKADVLKSYNKHYESKRANYAYFSKSGKSKYKHMTNSRIKDLKASKHCLNQPSLKKPATNAGVFGGSTLLYIDKRVPVYSTI